LESLWAAMFFGVEMAGFAFWRLAFPELHRWRDLKA
jgi:hypothetical protein